MKKAVIATTKYPSSGKSYEAVRSHCTLETIEAATSFGYKIVVVDRGSPAEYIHAMKERGAYVYDQKAPGMGNSRRQALKQARDLAPKGHAVVWIEPEKYSLVPLLDEAVSKATGGYDLVMLRRISLDSYPPEQAMAYQMVALAVKYLTGIDSDFMWGPTVLSRRAVDYYLNYKSRHGDLWDSIHCPKLHIINDGLPWTIVPVDYQHPPEQTAGETGIELFPRRIEQIDHLVRAIIEEVDLLGMRK